jgi:acyl-CoA dehydrogenase
VSVIHGKNISDGAKLLHLLKILSIIQSNFLMKTLFVTEKIKKLLPQIESFVETELFPLEISEYLTGNFSKVAGILDQKRQLVKSAGLWGLQHDLTLCEFGQVSEALGKSPFGHYTFGCQAPDIGNMELLHKFASKELKTKYLQPLIEGKIRSCFAMTEPEFAGSNPVNLGTTAVREGDEYVINGHKWFTTAADGAAFAVVMAVTNPNALPHQRASQIIVPTDSIGFQRVRNISIMGDSGDGWASHSELRFENVRVPVQNRIGAEGEGFVLAQERLGPGRIHHCMRWIGGSERIFDIMCRRAATRDMGDGTKLGDKQIIQCWIAESRTAIDSARLMVLHCAHGIDIYGAAAMRQQISQIKVICADLLMRIVEHAIQIHGAMGMTDDVILSFYYRHERAARIVDGTDEVHKISLARAILKSYGLKVKK